MLVDRSRFLTLAMTIAATTVACASQAPDDVQAGDEAALTDTGGACTADSIKKPGAGSMTPFAFQEGFCFDLARWEGTPDAEGVGVHFFDFIHDQCRAWSSQLQPAVAKKVQGCLAAADAKRPHNAAGDPTEEFDASTMYECGKTALFSICSDGIDARVNSGGRCDRIAAALKSKGDARILPVIVTECNAILSGMKSPARKQVEECVVKDPFDIWTCVEGMSVDFDGSADGEPKPTGAEACAAPTASAAPDASACAAIVARIQAAEEADPGASPEITKAVVAFHTRKCESYRTLLQPAAAKAAIGCLTASKSPDQDVYTCGTSGMKKVCRDTSVDATCKGLVETVTKFDAKANVGGRLTRQCRTLLSGLTPEGRDKVKSCVPARAESFKKIDASRFALYSCVESL